MNGNFLFLIIIGVTIYNLVSKTKSGTNGKTGQGKDVLTDSGRASDRQESAYRNPVQPSAYSAQKAAQSKEGAAKSGTAARHGSQTGAAARSQIKREAAVKTEEMSTTQYLRQKALEDQKDHEREARQEAARLVRESGGRRAAWRHYDGDSIPQGMRLVKCGYCGAENLIGNGQNQKAFTCYFCREEL